MNISELTKEYEITDFGKIKALEIDILKKFDEFCTEHDLKYCLTGGSLLGAVRHGGFIPWDDDVDISMFRPDYDRLIELSAKMPSDCKLFSRELNPNHSRLYGRICNTDYVSVDSYYDESLSGYFGIDIFPLEAVPSGPREYAKFSKKIRLLRRMFIFANSALFKGKSFLRAYILKPLPIIICKIIGADRIYKAFMKEVRSRDYDSAECIALVTGQYTEHERYPKDKYYDLIRIGFEGLNLPAIRSYDPYLKLLYGDYMKYPPKEQQIPHHSFKLYKIKKS